jgi:hypothetical protein
MIGTGVRQEGWVDADGEVQEGSFTETSVRVLSREATGVLAADGFPSGVIEQQIQEVKARLGTKAPFRGVRFDRERPGPGHRARTGGARGPQRDPETDPGWDPIPWPDTRGRTARPSSPLPPPTRPA